MPLTDAQGAYLVGFLGIAGGAAIAWVAIRLLRCACRSRERCPQCGYAVDQTFQICPECGRAKSCSANNILRRRRLVAGCAGVVAVVMLVGVSVIVILRPHVLPRWAPDWLLVRIVSPDAVLRGRPVSWGGKELRRRLFEGRLGIHNNAVLMMRWMQLRMMRGTLIHRYSARDEQVDSSLCVFEYDNVPTARTVVVCVARINGEVLWQGSVPGFGAPRGKPPSLEEGLRGGVLAQSESLRAGDYVVITIRDAGTPTDRGDREVGRVLCPVP